MRNNISSIFSWRRPLRRKHFISITNGNSLLFDFRVFAALLCVTVATSCKKEISNDGPSIVFKFKFDSTQERLSNIGQVAVMPAGHAGLSPVFNGMSSHYIELAPSPLTLLGQGAVLYRAAETTTGGDNAIDFSKSTIVKDGETFFSMPLKNITPGTYEWLRVSLAYQNYDVKYFVDTVISGFHFTGDFTGTVASFIGFNSYIQSYRIKTKEVTLNANRKQGYGGFETTVTAGGFTMEDTLTWQAPPGATTVPNPIFATSPIPQGSCVVTAAFVPGKLIITGNETKDIIVQVSLSTNKSFEWIDLMPDGKWEPGKGEQVVDMGVRGMIPKLQ